MDLEDFTSLTEFDPAAASRSELERTVGEFAALKAFAAAAELAADAAKRPADLFARQAREWASAKENDKTSRSGTDDRWARGGAG